MDLSLILGLQSCTWVVSRKSQLLFDQFCAFNAFSSLEYETGSESLFAVKKPLEKWFL
jgi:hypothetical protein